MQGSVENLLHRQQEGAGTKRCQPPCKDCASGKCCCGQVGMYALHGPVINVGYGRPDVNTSDEFGGVGSNTNDQRDYPADQLIAEWGAWPMANPAFSAETGYAAALEKHSLRWGRLNSWRASLLDQAVRLGKPSPPLLDALTQCVDVACREVRLHALRSGHPERRALLRNLGVHQPAGVQPAHDESARY